MSKLRKSIIIDMDILFGLDYRDALLITTKLILLISMILKIMVIWQLFYLKNENIKKSILIK